MWKKFFLFFNLFLSFFFNLQNVEGVVNNENPAEEITGYWKTINDKTGKPQSLVLIYPYQGKYFGRILATYNEDGSFGDTIYQPKERAPGIIGNPYYSGMDIIWGLEKKGAKYTDGKIVDPERGSIYDAELWLNRGNLVVRGELLFFGENQTWLRANEKDFPPNFKKLDIEKIIPIIPEVKK